MNSLALITIVFGVLMSFGYFVQTYKIFKNKSSKNVSLATYLFFAVGISVWLIYGISINNYPIIISNVLFLIGAFSVIVSYFLFKK